jgi:hypothetical protein
MSSSAFSNVPTRVYIGISTLTGNFNFDSTQDGYYLRYTGVSNITGTFQTDATTPIQNAAVFTLYQGGAGAITVTGASGVTVNGYHNTQGQYYAMQVIKVGTNLYDTVGAA